jgi:hypothetical protein
MNRKIRCAHCRCLCVPNPRVNTQRFCSNPSCQRARKAPWQRDKLATDPADRANQKDGQRSWQHQHPYYWRQYRLRRADYRERNRLVQQPRDHKRRGRPLAQRDAFETLAFVKPGIYPRMPEVGSHLAQRDALSQNCHVMPVTELLWQKRPRSTCLAWRRNITGTEGSHAETKSPVPLADPQDSRPLRFYRAALLTRWLLGQPHPSCALALCVSRLGSGPQRSVLLQLR